MEVNRDEILAMKVGHEFDSLIAREIFGVGEIKRNQRIKAYSTDIQFAGEIIEQLLMSNLTKNFYKLLAELSPGRAFPESICKAALLAKLESQG